jgi:hypothetical protein
MILHWPFVLPGIVTERDVEIVDVLPTITVVQFSVGEPHPPACQPARQPACLPAVCPPACLPAACQHASDTVQKVPACAGSPHACEPAHPHTLTKPCHTHPLTHPLTCALPYNDCAALQTRRMRRDSCK